MDLRRLRILLVEDNPEMREIVRTLLASWGATQLATATSVESALELLAREAFDLAIVDQRLGDGDGLDLVRRLRRSPTPFLPLLMLTSNASRTNVAAARDSGVNEFLAKPFSAKSLYLRLARLIYEPSPFVTCQDYVGPDRRRRADPDYKGPERRRQPPRS